MSRGTRLISLALLMFAATVAVRAEPFRLKPDATFQQVVASGFSRKDLPVHQSDVAADYAGSTACERCHQTEHAQWARSLHIRMTKPAAEALIVGDFDN